MRVVAGEARSIPLVTPSGKDTRPTTDRIKETLFNMIQTEVPGSCFLDLFAGSGGVGIEALSRGAKKAFFVEFGREAIGCIKTNLTKTKFVDKGILLPVEVSYGIVKLKQMGEKFDIVFADPPYNCGWEPKILQVLADNNVLQEGALVIIETSLKTEVDYVNSQVFDIEKIKDYKTNRHVFLRLKK